MENIQNSRTDNKFGVPIKFGILLGILSILIQQISYGILLPKNFLGWVTGLFLVFAVTVALLFIAAAQQRKAFGGYISFKEVFQATFIVIVISSLMAMIWGIVYIKFINPDLADTFRNSMMNFMERHNVPQDKIDESSAKMDVSKFRDISIGVRLLNLATIIIMKSVVALLVAVIMKREPKVQML